MLLTTKKVELIKKKEFIVIAFDLDHKVFIVYIATFYISFHANTELYCLKKAQIAYLKADETCIKVFNKYADFADIFLPK